MRLIREIETNRSFLLETYRQNPVLLVQIEPRIRALLEPIRVELVRSRLADEDQAIEIDIDKI